MKEIYTLQFWIILIFVSGNQLFATDFTHLPEDPYLVEKVVVVPLDTFPLTDRYENSVFDKNYNPFDLKDPSAIEKTVEYDPETGQYIIYEKIGQENYRPPTYMTFDEYMEYTEKEQQESYFSKLSGVSTGREGVEAKDPIAKIDIENSLIDRLFGGTDVKITPQGNINLTFGVDQQRVDNPQLTERQRRNGGFDFDLAIQMSVQGKIGEKLNLNTNYNTQATFDFENQLKLSYDADAFSEDEIIKRIEAGNVRLPLRTNLIEGSESLFGVLTELQFGKLWITAVASQQKSQREQLQIQGGAELQEFEVFADSYDENRHFFISQYHREHFEEALINLPQINSQTIITRMEVWITNDRNATEGGVRDIVGLADLGEGIDDLLHNPDNVRIPAIPFARDSDNDALPANESNDLYTRILGIPGARTLNNSVATLQGPRFNLTQAKDFEKVRARLLSPSEYSFNSELGFVSVNVNLRPDQVLGVSYQYTYKGEVYTVGELTNDVPIGSDTLGVIFTKLLKSTTQRVDLPTWDLMMKNIYGIGAFQVGREDFKLDVFYEDPGNGEKRFLPESNLSGTPLIRVFNLDNLNSQGDPLQDGVFDFVPGLTINTQTGRVMFPVLEPFGSSLAAQIDDQAFIEQYVYEELYDSTITQAREFPEFNRFKIAGSFKSSVSSEISLGAFNLPEGSVTVTAGGRELQEGVDYEVDYNIGRIKILNDAILNSGTPVNVSFENNSLFGFQNRTMLGLRADYRFSEELSLGGTYMHLFERPFTQKVNIGDDPINNRIFGVDISLDKNAPWLTKIVDGIPFINTKEPSRINFTAEGAYLKPGHSRAINLGESEGETDEEREDRLGGSVYLDDFEGSTSSFDLRQPTNQWFIASVPQNDESNNNPLFPESALIDDINSGVNRALINWYRIDPSVNCADSAPSDSYCATISLSEIFPNQQIAPGQNSTAQTFNLSYYPNERGPYNFDLPGGGVPNISAGMLADGTLAQPSTRWGGIMRALNQNNFEASNIEYLEFWMMSPFIPDANGAVASDGKLYVELGNISEDILRDSRLAFENGLPTPNSLQQVEVDQTSWGAIPRAPIVVNAFDNDPTSRDLQDVGLDGLDDAGELEKYEDVINQYRGALTQVALDSVLADPANDNFRFFDNASSDEVARVSEIPMKRYAKFNNQQGNSAANNAGSIGDLGGRLQSSTNIPDSEDLNTDNTLSETESYFQYEIPISHDGINGVSLNRFIADTQVGSNGRIWYRYLIPLNEFTRRVGGIQNFRSIRFMRMYLKDFSTTVNLRFATLELVRNQWRRYQRNLDQPGISIGPEADDGTEFVVNSVNIEENSEKAPFNYVIPRGIQREQSLGAFPQILQNEQSLALNVCDLQDGDARAIYRNINFDMRVYERIKMFVHAEDILNSPTPAEFDDLSFFMRIGSDYEENYYEYEIPLLLSDPDITNDGSDDFINEVWRAENEINFELQLLRDIKVERNGIAGFAITDVFEQQVENPNDPGGTRMNTVRVKGNPNLGLVKGMMLGVRNKKNGGGTVCAEVWVNELRLNGLDERAGGAAIARLDMQLADFGNVSVSTEYRSNGWRRLNEKLAQTQREEVLSFDATTSLELSKFLPEEWEVKIPFYASISETRKNPEFDPYDLDIPLKEKLARAEDREERETIREQAQDVSSIKTYNFTNVRKERTTERVPLPFDISNFSFTYAKTITEKSDPLIERDRIDQTRGAVSYNYSTKPLYISPFKKLIKGEKLGKHLGLIKDANINLIPSSFSFNTIVDRTRAETKYRFAGEEAQFNTFFDKRFTWDRNYTLQWNLTKNLDFNFNANNLSVIDELSEFDQNGVLRPRDELNDFIVENLRGLGRNKSYAHNANVSYTLPFKSIPLLDWVSARVQYSASYGWDAAALNVTELGNIIQNSSNRQGNLELNFEQLYKKSKYLSKINGGNRSNSRSSRGSSRLQTATTDKADKGDKKKTKTKKERELSIAEKVLIRPFMLIRKGRLNYQENLSTVLPGYLPNTQYLGLEEGFSAPGWDFVAGLQPDQAWIDEAGEAGWITGVCLQNHEITQTRTQNITANLTIEPFKDFRIELEANRNVVRNNSELFSQNEDTGDFEHLTPRENGSYTTSFFALQSLFGNNDEIDYQNLFSEFLDNREVISGRLGIGTHDRDSTIFTEGFGETSVDVLIPSFLAAYTQQDANDVAVGFEDQLRTLPKLNWRVNYRGLEKIPAFENVFKSFTLNHSYRSTLSVNSFNTDLDYDINNPFQKNGITQNFYSRFEVPAITITEEFSPLLGVDMQFDNELSLRLDYSRSRDLRLGLTDFILAETNTTAWTIGASYVAKDVIIGFLKGGSAKKRKGKSSNKDDDDAPSSSAADEDTPLNFKGGDQPSDLTFTFDFSLRDDLTGNHSIESGTFTATRGLTSLRISPSVDYDVNDNLNLRLFFDYSFTNPKISSSFPITSSQGGVQVQFTLN